MSRMVADFKAFGLAYLRSRTGFFFALIFPVILILVFGAIFSQSGGQKVNLPVQDLDNSYWSQTYLRFFNQTGAFTVQMISSDVNFDQYIKDKTLVLAMLIPSGFGDNVSNALNLTGPPATVVLKGDPTNTYFAIGQGAANAVASQLAFYGHHVRDVAVVQSQNLGKPQYTFIDFFVPGMIAFTALTTPMFSMSSICSEYRNRGFFKLLGSTPLKKSEWLTAKILWYAVLMLASIAIMYAVGIAAFNAHFTITPMAILLVVVGVFLFTSFGMFLGVFVSNPESASALANAIGFPMMFLSGIFFQLESMPQYLQYVAKALPLTYLAEGLRATMSLGNEVVAATDLVILLISGLILFVIAARAMSWKGK
jgi:ABC-2 type transport system permease protein